MMRFKEFLEYELSVPFTINIPNSVFGALATTWTGSQAVPAPNRAMPSGGFVGSPWNHQLFDLGLPGTTRTSRIVAITDKQNPIKINLEDGTELDIPPEVLPKIKGEPKVGKMMMVIFQRRPEDTSPNRSQIQSIYCF